MAGRPDKAIAAGLGLAPEDRKSQGLLMEWSLAKNVSLANLGQFLRRRLLSLSAEREATTRQLEALNTVPADVERVVAELSGGNQQKVVLARWLLRECRVLLLDEPTRGVDVATKAELYRVITDLAARGIGVVVVSSELDELAGICTRVLVMQEGRLVAEVAGEETSELDLLRHAVTASGQAEYRDEIAKEASVSTQRLSIPSLGAGRLRTQEYALVGVIAILILVGAILEGGSFASVDNFRAILTQASVVGVVAVGMTFVIATSGIDLSVGSMLAAAGIAGGLLVDSGSAAFILGALAFGLVLGGFNGVAIAYGRVVPFIATLAMFAMARGLALLMSDKLPISLFSADGVRWFGTGEIVTIPVSILIFLLITALGWVGLNRTRYGRYVVAVGGNREAARIAGVPVQRIIFSVYCLTGLLAGLAAILLSARLASASPVSGNLLELDAIGAVVIGGTSLAGGRATIVGTFLGVIVFAIIFNLLTQLNLATEWQQIVKGVIILAAVLIQRPERI